MKYQAKTAIVRAARARYSIEYVDVKKKLHLRTGDPIHVITALDAATTVQELVIFLTSLQDCGTVLYGLVSACI